MFSSEILKPNYRRAEKEAIDLLNRSGIYRPPVNPVEIARVIGVSVRFAKFAETAHVSGLFDCDNNEIIVNGEEVGERQIFTIAHEIGHKVLHEDWVKSDAYKIFRRDREPLGKKDRYEQEADAFAANLLMPRQFVKRFKDMPLNDVAKIFAVSVSFARARMEYLNTYGY